jgi:hypothetical protein
MVPILSTIFVLNGYFEEPGILNKNRPASLAAFLQGPEMAGWIALPCLRQIAQTALRAEK